MKRTITPKREPKDWFRVKKYPHIGLPIKAPSRSWVQSYVQDKTKVEVHSFLPFIHREAKVRRFRKEISQDGVRSLLRKPSQKKRELYYASHLDSNIYSYYASILSHDYEGVLVTRQISECVTAYRRIPLNSDNRNSRNKCNVDFANDVFSFIKRSTEDCLVAMTFDIKSFFDSLDHRLLKKLWRSAIGSGSNLPPDHYNVYKNITRFSYVDERQVFNFFKDRIVVERKPSIKRRGISKRKYLKGKRATAFCFLKELTDLKKHNLIKSNKYEADTAGGFTLRRKGIPQGSPISSVLANIYMIDFDVEVSNFIKGRGIYRRYSDDILVVCTPDLEDKLISFLEATIKKFKLETQNEKTQIFHFTKDANSGHFECREKNLVTRVFQTNTKFEYLGFQFDGFNTLLKSSSLATFYRKMKRSIRRGYFYAVHNRTRSKGELFKNRLYKRFTHLGAHRRRVFQRDKNNTSQFVLTHRYDWGNYLSYAYLAAKVIPDNKIKRQVRRHWKKFHELIEKTATL